MENEKLMFLRCVKYDPIMVRAAADKLNALPVFVIFKKPKDYPDNIVVRLQFAGRGKIYLDNVAVAVNTMAEARQIIPIKEMGLTPFSDRQDESYIVESWL